MSTAMQARAGKNVGSLSNAQALIGELNVVIKSLPMGSTSVNIAPTEADAKASSLSLAPAPVGKNPAAPIVGGFLIFKNGTATPVLNVTAITYRWDGKDINLLGGALLPVAAGTYVGIPVSALPQGGVISPADGPITITTDGPGLTLFYGLQNNNNKGLNYKRTTLTGTGRVDVMLSEPGVQPALPSIAAGGLVFIVSGFHEVNYDSIAHAITYYLVDDTGATVDSFLEATPLPVFGAPLASRNPNMTVANFVTWAVPPGWKIQASLDVPVANPNNPVLILSQFNQVNETPVGPGGAGAY